jgi:hypothetical protein
MKYIKMIATIASLGILAVAALGGSAASAKTCSTAGQFASCGAGHGNIYVGLVIKKLTPGKAWTLESGFVSVSCASSEITMKVTNGETAAQQIESFSLAECTSGLGACTAKANSLPWSGTGAVSTAPNGVQKVKNPAFEFTCAGVTCKYGAAEITEEAVGSDTVPETVYSKVPVSKEAGSSAFCSSTGTWSATYKVTSPTSFFTT